MPGGRQIKQMKSLFRGAICFVVLLVLSVNGMGESQAEDMIQECLHAHNAVRAQLGEQPLKWSEELASQAQWWANILATDRQFRHEPNRDWGQNLFLIEGGYSTAGGAINAWAAEAIDYDSQQNRCSGDMCGHYTQIVWRNTRQVGCAHAWRGLREVWVCDYFPPGNVVGQRPFNISLEAKR